MSQAIGKHTITKDDTLEPLNTVLRNGNGDPYDLADYTVRFQIETESGTVELATTATGVTKHPTQVFTLDSTNNWIYCEAHGYAVDDVWVPATSGSLSGTGLTAATRYRIVETDGDWFKVSLRSKGIPVTIAGAGTGTHTGYVVGSVQFDFAAAQTDTVGLYRGWYTLDSGSELKTLPEGDRYYRIEVVEKGN